MTIYTMNAQAVKPTRVRCLPVTALRQSAARDSALGLKLYETMARELPQPETHADDRPAQRHGTRSGVPVAFCVAISGNGKSLPASTTDDAHDIGDFLGLTIETVSRTFTKLKLMHLIELAHSNHVKVLDMYVLAELADGNAKATPSK